MSEALVILFVLFLWTALLTAIAVARRLIRGRPTDEEVEVEELRARYARGEIPYALYERRRRQLTEKNPTAEHINEVGAKGAGGHPTC